ncbi:TetR/AcrR family transcriptional regulator [Desulfobulbus rhabdoformis]|uniref:TetR/AcrR family transcriptional regulator n=1 Tax=Desulfobulbus rhabdoformis TaxID=34032 RepID=UPI001962F1AD|nr:TetR/AcrR family transcriptional regulator [Desulfobulbus rhabdoformis]MBM9616867.1 TetR/AcrR family transcriptional regulator [Desulfobulbus rhabdoformis]
MNKTQQKIAAGLEQAFAENGFAKIGVDGLRDASNVSLRTLYKYCPSREDMIKTALEYRHTRYLRHLFEALPAAPDKAIEAIFDRVGEWMSENAPGGCLFHRAVAAYPDNYVFHEMLERHKREMGDAMVRVTGLSTFRDHFILLHEGITQSWPLIGERSVASAKMLARNLLSAD